MGLLFAQVEKAFIEGPELSNGAAQLGLDEDALLGKATRAWMWSVEHAAPEGLITGPAAVRAVERAAGWNGKQGAFVKALPSVFEVSEAAVRFKGWPERYGKMLKTKEKDVVRQRNRRTSIRASEEQSELCHVERHADGPVDTPPDVPLDDVVDGPRDPSTSTILDLDLLSSSSVLASPLPSERVVPLPKKPDDPWASGSCLFAWVQRDRFDNGYATEKPPRLAALNAFFSEFLMELNGDTERGEATLAAYFQDADPYWRTRNYPFAGFMSQWRKYVPRRIDS